MDALIALLVFLFGVGIGSFLNVVALRINTGRGLTGRSSCPVCNETLSWFELIPLASFLLQLGRCRRCLSRISWQYPLVELLTGVLLLGIHLKLLHIFPGTDYVVLGALYVCAFALLVVITIYDIHHKIIPDVWVYPFGVVALTVLFAGASFNPASLDILAGPLLAAPFALLWLLSHGRWMGLGDAKLALGIGWLLGFIGGISAVVLAFWIGALYGLVVMGIESSRGSRLWLRHANFTMKSEVPFAPFLVLGTMLTFFFDLELLLQQSLLV